MIHYISPVELAVVLLNEQESEWDALFLSVFVSPECCNDISPMKYSHEYECDFQHVGAAFTSHVNESVSWVGSS